MVRDRDHVAHVLGRTCLWCRGTSRDASGDVRWGRVLVIERPAGKAGGVTSSSSPLPERARAMIEFEATWFDLDEDRHLAIRARFARSVEDYNLELNRVIDDPQALAADPLVVLRLRRQRERRRRSRIDGAATADHGGRA